VTIEQAATMRDELVAFLNSRTKTAVDPEQDLFASGLVSSMFAMELVVHLESTYDVAILGADLKLANLRSVDRMVELVDRLRAGESGDRA
jgi:methoxymalonate biosynthesis acyl carrier protein